MLSRADAAFVQRDRALPGLATLLDNDAMTSRLHALGTEAQNLRVEATYLRYKPATSCLVAYQVSDGQRTFPMYAKAYAAHSDKLERRTEASLTAGACFVWDDIATQVSLFPYDRRLKPLAKIAQADKRRELLQTALPYQPEYWDGELTHLRYKPERRYVARLTSADGVQAAFKAYEAEEFEQALRGAYAVTENGVINQPHLIGASSQYRFLVFEWKQGETLLDLLESHQLQDTHLSALAQASARFHLDECPRVVLPSRTPTQELSRIEAAANAIAIVCPEWAARAAQLRATLSQSMRHFPTRGGLIYGDFKPDQVICAADGLSFLDFDQASLGDYASDLGSFVAQVERGALLGLWSTDEAPRVVDHLLRTYARATDRTLAHRLHVYTAAHLLLIAPHEFRNRVPNWHDITHALLTRIEEVIAHVCSTAA